VKIDATFVSSVVGANGFPRDGLAQVAMVGRSNVGKSSLINALSRQRIARTSAAPGKTRLANVYRVARGSAGPLYVVDLPGYGYARGDAGGFGAITQAFFDPARQHGAGGGAPARIAALLLVDGRHPGLDSDREAWRWLQSIAAPCGIVATKIDKLSRAERQRAIRQYEAVLEHPVLPVSAATGEGLDQLWTLIDTLANNPLSSSNRRSNRSRRPEPSRRKGTGPRPPRR
jgi:GTP-binding protein